MTNRLKYAGNAGQALVAAIVGLVVIIVVGMIIFAVMASRGGHDTGGNVGGYPDCDRGDQIEHDTDCGYTAAEHKRCKKFLKKNHGRSCVGGEQGRKKASVFQKLKQKKQERKLRKELKKKRATGSVNSAPAGQTKVQKFKARVKRKR